MIIKNVFYCALVVALLSGTTIVQAQNKVPPRRGGVAPKPRANVNMGAGVKDGLTMKGGRVILTELGVSNPLTTDKKLINGTTISTTGLVTGTDGTTTQMGEGDVVSLTGRVTTRTSIVEADSLLKIKAYDLKYPGKRKKAEAERARKEKDKKEREEAKAKAKAKKK
jgi:hypothetical protein